MPMRLAAGLIASAAQRVGVLQDLHGRPGNLFVAEFIGYPRMDVVDAVIRNGRLRSGALALSLPSPSLADGLGEGTESRWGFVRGTSG